MAEDQIRYDILAQEALRGVMRKVLAEEGGADVYRYEGLYQVVGSSYGPGKSGFRVFVFRLRPIK